MEGEWLFSLFLLLLFGWLFGWLFEECVIVLMVWFWWTVF